MKVQNNITVFSGDTRNNAQAEWVKKEGTDSSDKKSKTIYAGNFLKEFPLREKIQQKKAEVQQRALKIVQDAWDGDRQLDDEIKMREEQSKALRQDNQEALDNLKDVNQRMEELREAFGVSPDSEEQQELERMMQSQGSPVAGRVFAEDLTEYQKRALALNEEGARYRKQIAVNNGQILKNSDETRAIRRERVKSHTMVDAQIQAAAQALEQIRAREYQSQYTKQLADTQARIEGLRREVSRQRHILSGLKPGVQCPMCKQTVTEETLPQVRKEFTVSVNELCRQGQAQTGQLKELQELDAKARAVFEQFRQEDAAKANAALSALKEKRGRMVEDSQDKSAERQKEIDRLHAEIQNTELDLEYGLLSPKEGERLRRIKEELTTLSAEINVLTEQTQAVPAAELDTAPLETDKKEKQALLSAVASYIAKRVELRLSRLQMNRVAISLYSVMKTTGEVKEAFKFVYEDRPYICLSGSERIKAGLEVSELLKSLVGVNFPVFIDDAERVPVIDNVRPTGQIFIAQVVKGARLTVQASSAAPAQAA